MTLKLKLAIDARYYKGRALVAGVLFPAWDTQDITRTLIKDIGNVKPYEPGKFYKRELPCILSLLGDITEPLSTIIIDGFVWLGPEKEPGLGMHLYDHLNRSVPVIGAAKTPFRDTPAACEVYRGKALRPLYITSAGISLIDAKRHVASMHGPYRIPTLLKKVDRLSRSPIPAE
jgi:deoxyribonuclease V